MVTGERLRAVFLDRDGVITVPLFRDGRSFAPTTFDQFAIYPDAPAAITRLKTAGFAVIVATNQPEVSRGGLSPAELDRMHACLSQACDVDAIEVSTATREAPDRRRKPSPGMLLDAAERWNIALPESYMVGDRSSDIACGRAAGTKTVFIDLGYTSEVAPTEQDATVSSLTEAVDWILADKEEKNAHVH